MKKLSAVCLLALAPAMTMANIIPTGTTITGAAGDYGWTYNLTLSADQDLVAGPAPTVNPASCRTSPPIIQITASTWARSPPRSSSPATSCPAPRTSSS